MHAGVPDFLIPFLNDHAGVTENAYVAYRSGRTYLSKKQTKQKKQSHGPAGVAKWLTIDL